LWEKYSFWRKFQKMKSSFFPELYYSVIFFSRNFLVSPSIKLKDKILVFTSIPNYSRSWNNLEKLISGIITSTKLLFNWIGLLYKGIHYLLVFVRIKNLWARVLCYLNSFHICAFYHFICNLVISWWLFIFKKFNYLGWFCINYNMRI